ncbi:PEP-CTERM sorting domain-containing protein [Rugamonas rivuli]|uniref:PEP-CTERM sorting domain-containing protein n=1 Tax=Rugamonas rivuli TaxID=2743358 RepID=A0A843SEH0_9BURK|nr:PEP-CTERM sorting domain-containing protein [Rugamonas rivuli]MQA21532.1 PEP-CTERM sorting domain-containing protein [Rugamonas rivuli]
MLKKIIISGLLAASATLAHADTPAPTRWAFLWTGFYADYDQSFHPEYYENGTFGGVDANHDGVIGLNELSELKIDGIDYVTSNCQGTCSVISFSYVLGGELSFLARNRLTWNAGDVTVINAVEYETGVAIRYTTSYGGHHDDASYFFTPKTVETITQLTPVPEPESYAMLGAGLLLLAGVARSKKKAGR